MHKNPPLIFKPGPGFQSFILGRRGKTSLLSGGTIKHKTGGTVASRSAPICTEEVAKSGKEGVLGHVPAKGDLAIFA